MIDQEDMLEIEAEDVGGTSPLASLLTTVFSQYGTGTYRFVARPHGPDPRRPSDAVIGATFPGTRPSIEDVAAQAPGSTSSANASRSCTSSCSATAGARPGTVPPGGRPSTTAGHRPPAGAVGATAGAAVVLAPLAGRVGGWQPRR